MVAKLMMQSERKKSRHQKLQKKQQQRCEKKIQEQRASCNVNKTNKTTSSNSVGTQSTCAIEDVPPIRVITFVRKEV